MTLKDKIILDLTKIKNPNLLNQIFEFMQLVKDSYSVSQESNRVNVLKFAGTITNEEAHEIKSVIDKEFNNLEGDW